MEIQNTQDDEKSQTPEIDFEYADGDTYGDEIAELYSYAEVPEFQLNLNAFEYHMKAYKFRSNKWLGLETAERYFMVQKLKHELELTDEEPRMRAAHSLLYIMQGCWNEMHTESEQQQCTRENCMLVIEMNLFAILTEALNVEIGDKVAESGILPKRASWHNVRVILNALYHIAAVIRWEKHRIDFKTSKSRSPYEYQVEKFCDDVSYITCEFETEELFVARLFNLVQQYSFKDLHFPLKKVLLLAWKLILLSFGCMKDLNKEKKRQRHKAHLPTWNEDSAMVLRMMKPSAPPCCEQIVSQGPTSPRVFKEIRPLKSETAQALPWETKTQRKDMEHFVKQVCQKFLQYKVKTGTMPPLNIISQLPQTIQDSVRLMRQKQYTSLGDAQVAAEEPYVINPCPPPNQKPCTKGTRTIVNLLYDALLPQLPSYIDPLLRVLFVVGFRYTSTMPVSILLEVTDEKNPKSSTYEKNFPIEIQRHQEILVKAVSGILFLILKQFKLNHVYQFECLSSHLLKADYIRIVLKLFSLDMSSYVCANYNIPSLNFPRCVLRDDNPVQSTADLPKIELSKPSYCWRNMYACVNLLRVLNKITKRKDARIITMTKLEAVPILQSILKVRNATMQVYALKLLKMQIKFLGKDWRNSNITTINLIYSKVRHNINDHWVCTMKEETRLIRSKGEEKELSSAVDQYNKRLCSCEHHKIFNFYKNEALENGPAIDDEAEKEIADEFQRIYNIWWEQQPHVKNKKAKIVENESILVKEESN